MIKQPTRNYKLTDEEVDGIMYFLHLHAMQDDPNACYLAAKLHLQQNYNPSDEPIILPESKQTLTIKVTDK